MNNIVRFKVAGSNEDLIDQMSDWDGRLLIIGVKEEEETGKLETKYIENVDDPIRAAGALSAVKNSILNLGTFGESGE